MAGAKLQFFERELKLATSEVEPAAISAKLARYAKEALGDAIDSGEASASYARFVNGVEGAAEESVRPDGAILYTFQYLSEVGAAAKDIATAASPEDSGRYKRSWFFLVGGGAVDQVPDDADSFILTNDQPYARKIDVGHMRMSVPPGIIERTKQQLLARYGNTVTARRIVIELAGGYVLKGHFRKGVRAFSRKGLRKDTAAGQPLTYPALLVTLR